MPYCTIKLRGSLHLTAWVMAYEIWWYLPFGWKVPLKKIIHTDHAQFYVKFSSIAILLGLWPQTNPSVNLKQEARDNMDQWRMLDFIGPLKMAQM